MFLYGASGHSKVIIDIIRAVGETTVDALYDDNPKYIDILGVPVNNDASFLQNGNRCIISIGNNRVRQKIAMKIDANFVSAIHPKAVVAPSSTINFGTVVMAGAVINADAVVGTHCIVNTASVIEHDCILGDYVHVSPNAALAGNVIVGEGTHVGIGACVIQGVNIGKWVTVGAGCVVIDDIPDYAVVVGNPGRIIKFNEIE